jgi:UAA transporter family
LTSSVYGLQVLAKSCKMIPVMIMGTLVGGKRYSVIEYVCSGLIAGGISLFAAQVNVMACCLPLLCTGSDKVSRERDTL